MAMSMKEKAANSHVNIEWSPALKQEFARESAQPNGCVGSELLSETDKMRVWTIRLKPGERIGFHRHVLNYFWTSVTGGRGRQHLMDGTTIEYSYYPGETRHETYGPGEFKVHDLENLGDQDMVFMTVEFDRGLGQQAAAGARHRAAAGGVAPLAPIVVRRRAGLIPRRGNERRSS